MTDLVVRAARAPELAEVGRITLDAYLADGYLLREHSYAERLLDADTRARKAELLVAADAEDQLLGTVTVCRAGTPYAEISRPDELEFRMLAVTPTARGRGVGLALVTAVIEQARAQGCRGIVLSSLDRMRGTHRLYERLGFVRATDRDRQSGDHLVFWAFILDLS